MSKFFDETMESLLQAVEIAKTRAKKEEHNMNGYILQAEAYKKLAEQGQISVEEADKMRAVYAFLGTNEKHKLYALFDSGAFNGIVKGYLKLALRETEAGKEMTEKVLDELRRLLDTTRAEEAESWA